MSGRKIPEKGKQKIGNTYSDIKLTTNGPRKLTKGSRANAKSNLDIPDNLGSEAEDSFSPQASSSSLELTFNTLPASCSPPHFLRAPTNADNDPPLSHGWLSEPTTPSSEQNLNTTENTSSSEWPGAQPVEESRFVGPSSYNFTSHALPNTASSSSSTSDCPHHNPSSNDDYEVPQSWNKPRSQKPLSPQLSFHTLTPVSSFSGSTGSEQDAGQNLFYASKKLGSRASS